MKGEIRLKLIYDYIKMAVFLSAFAVCFVGGAFAQLWVIYPQSNYTIIPKDSSIALIEQNNFCYTPEDEALAMFNIPTPTETFRIKDDAKLKIIYIYIIKWLGILFALGALSLNYIQYKLNPVDHPLEKIFKHLKKYNKGE